MNMNFYTTLSNEEALTLGERLSLGLTNTLLGLLIIFLVLTILFGAVKLFAILLPKLTEKKKDSKSKAPQTDKSAESIAKAPASHPATADNGAVIAAITAAVSLLLEEEGQDPTGFRVVSFRRSDERKSAKH